MREEVKSTMDFVPVETMWGDRDIWLTIERGPEFLTVAKELSDYIAGRAEQRASREESPE